MKPETTGVGIWASALHTGHVARANDFWPPEVVSTWDAPRRQGMQRLSAFRSRANPLQQAAIDAMLAGIDDPFYGVRQRFHITPGTSAGDLAIAAARDAIAKAGIAPGDVEFVLNADFIPDAIGTNTACVIHQGVGLSPNCLALNVDTSANSFLTQFQIARALILSGQAKIVLAVQTNVASRVLPLGEDHSAVFGDACSAVVFGAVRPGYGLLSINHATDGSLQNAVVAGVPGANWWDDGRAVLYTPDMGARGRMFMTLPMLAVELSQGAMHAAGVAPDAIDFYAPHQGLVWLRAVSQRALGLTNAAFRDTYPQTGNLSQCNAVASITAAADDHGLREGARVLFWTGGNGSTSSSAVLRWGGRDA